ncbi:MAG TPA: sigma 54-interacting transcriptional regulator [Balneolaceae bacterium]
MIASPSHNHLQESQLTDVEKSSRSVLMRDIFYKILSLAKLSSNAIVVGEIGSGKKRLAHIIHENSYRANGPFYSFYCVDVDEERYKDAFWGHLQFEEEHITLKYDAIEKASGGILYLDQFSELPPAFMLNILKSFLKGSKQLFRYDTTHIPRLVISFNQESFNKIFDTPLWDKILDLLDPMVVMLPPLRERKEDIPVLIDHFIDEIKKKNSEWKNLSISAQALCECFKYSWPGNIRQLKNAILQGAILSYGKTIECKHLPFSMSWQLPYEFDGNKLFL